MLRARLAFKPGRFACRAGMPIRYPFLLLKGSQKEDEMSKRSTQRYHQSNTFWRQNMPETGPLNKTSLLAPGHVTVVDSTLNNMAPMLSFPIKGVFLDGGEQWGLLSTYHFHLLWLWRGESSTQLGTVACLPHTAMLLRRLGDGGGQSRSSIATFRALLAVWIQLSFVLHLLCVSLWIRHFLHMWSK